VLRRWSSRLHATLGSDGARVRLLRRVPFAEPRVVSDQITRCGAAATDITEVISALDEALRATADQGHDIAGLRCDVTVGDVWMVYDVIEGDLSDAPRRTADDLAGAALADTAGTRRDEIVVRWQRQGKLRNLACALPIAAIQSLQGVLHRHRVGLGSVVGEMVVAYNDRRHGIEPARSVLAVPRAAGTQLGLIVDSGFSALRFEPLVSEPAPLLDRCRTLMRSTGIEPDERTRFYADETLSEDADARWIRQVPPARWSQRFDYGAARARLDLDLSPTRPAVRPLSWVLLVAGAATVSLAAVQFQTASGQHLRASRALQSLEASLNETRSGGAARLPPDEARRARASAEVVKELQVPWGKLFSALEAVSGKNVALLSVEPSAQRREIRVVAEAKSSGAMLDFLEALRAQSLHDVVLVSHQVQAQTPGTPLRFQARAVWDSQ
jgi:hypothetical protein